MSHEVHHVSPRGIRFVRTPDATKSVHEFMSFFIVPYFNLSNPQKVDSGSLYVPKLILQIVQEVESVGREKQARAPGGR